MPKAIHAHKHRRHKNEDSGQKGFIADTIRRSMNKNEKIIMGLLVGGIVTFLVLSIVILFGRGGQSLEEITTNETTSVAPTIKVLKTPYPTNPPVDNFLMQVKEDGFYPDDVRVSVGASVTIINIGSGSITLTPTTRDNAYEFGTIGQSEEKTVTFDKAGTYRYTSESVAEDPLTIVVN